MDERGPQPVVNQLAGLDVIGRIVSKVMAHDESRLDDDLIAHQPAAQALFFALASDVPMPGSY